MKSVDEGNIIVLFSTDDRVDNPVSLYTATKKNNELFAHCYSKLYDIPTTGLRFFTVYGPTCRPDMAYFVSQTSCERLVALGESLFLELFNDLVGRQVAPLGVELGLAQF